MELARKVLSTQIPPAVAGEYISVTDTKDFAQGRVVDGKTVWVSIRTGKTIGAQS